MIAHERTVEEIADELGADSLAYLSMDGVYEAIGTPPEDHCDACFTGRYPLGDPEDGERQVRARGHRRSPASRCPADCINSRPGVESMRSRDAAMTVPHRRPRLGHRHQPAGDPRPAARAGWDRGGRGRLRQARGAGAWSGRATAGVETAVFPRGDYADRAARDAAMADWIEARGADLVVLAGYMQLLQRRLRRAASATGSSTSTRRCCPPSPASTRSARRSSAGVEIDRGHRPLRRRGRRHRAGHPAARGRGPGEPRPGAAGGGDPRRRARALPGGDPHDRGGQG